MLDTLMQQFLGSGAASETVSALTQQGLSQPQATSALSATAVRFVVAAPLVVVVLWWRRRRGAACGSRC